MMNDFSVPTSNLPANNSSSQLATDRLSQLLQKLQAEQAAISQAHKASQLNTLSEESSETASLADALARFRTPVTPAPQTPVDLPPLPADQASWPAWSDLDQNAMVIKDMADDQMNADRMYQAMDKIQAHYAQGKVSIGGLVQALKADRVGAASNVSQTPSAPQVSPVSSVAPQQMPPQAAPVQVPSTQPTIRSSAEPNFDLSSLPNAPKQTMHGYLSKLSDHLEKHGRLVLTDYRTGSKV